MFLSNMFQSLYNVLNLYWFIALIKQQNTIFIPNIH